MSLNASTLRRLAALSLAPDIMAEVLEIMADAVDAKSEASAGAVRQKRYRERHQTVISDVTRDVTRDVTVTSPPPSQGSPKIYNQTLPNPSSSSLRSSMSVLEKPKQDVLPECLQPSVEKSKNSYPPAFSLLWDTFARNPNSSKSLAFAAWKRLSSPDRELCLDGAMAYGEWLQAEQKRRVRDPPVAIHLVNFIKQRRWESLLETAT